MSWLVVGCTRDPGAPATVSAPPRAAASASTAPALAGAPSSAATALGGDLGANLPDAEPPRLTLYIQPLGAELPEVDVAFVERALGAFYGVTLQRLERVPLPDSTRNDARTRYRAEKLLELLADRLPSGGDRILGLTGVDISTTKGEVADWGILGLATLDGSTCVISKFRTGRGTRSVEHARERLGKVAVHEIGHTLGLEHCPTLGCLMEDARGTVFTTDREHDLCPVCRDRLDASGYVVHDDPGAIPWAAPSARLNP